MHRCSFVNNLHEFNQQHNGLDADEIVPCDAFKTVEEDGDLCILPLGEFSLFNWRNKQLLKSELNRSEGMTFCYHNFYIQFIYH